MTQEVNGFNFNALVRVTNAREEVDKDGRPVEAECCECGKFRRVERWFQGKDPMCLQCWFDLTG